MSKTRTHGLEERKREERIGELRNVARHKARTHKLRGRKREERVGELGTWHVTNEDSLAGGKEEGGAGW